jgi:mRNA interferase RelE/StbE
MSQKTSEFEPAIRRLERQAAEARDRVRKKLREARKWTEQHLEGSPGWPYYKLRAGDYRAIITWDREENVLYVEAVNHRQNIYDHYLPP